MGTGDNDPKTAGSAKDSARMHGHGPAAEDEDSWVKWQARFWSKVDKTPGHGPHGFCWLWTASKTHDGYGQFKLDKRIYRAHRVVYTVLVGSISEGLQLDHICRVRCCVNPAHLEPVTHAENMRRGAHTNKTHCPRGHEYTQENTYIEKRGERQGRHCKACDLARRRDRRRQKRALRSAGAT